MYSFLINYIVMRKLEVKKGDKYGRLTVMRESAPFIRENGYKRRLVLCLCDCGEEKIIGLNDVRTGHTKSCGCYSKEVTSGNKKTHGMRHTRIYNIYHHIRGRCLSKTNQKYKNYGERGIKICGKWMTFEGFYEDMKEGYQDHLTIDRINNDGNYCKENCQWSSLEMQSLNKTTSRFITYKGKTQNLCLWAK